MNFFNALFKKDTWKGILFGFVIFGFLAAVVIDCNKKKKKRKLEKKGLSYVQKDTQFAQFFTTTTPDTAEFPTVDQSSYRCRESDCYTIGYNRGMEDKDKEYFKGYQDGVRNSLHELVDSYKDGWHMGYLHRDSLTEEFFKTVSPKIRRKYETFMWSRQNADLLEGSD